MGDKIQRPSYGKQGSRRAGLKLGQGSVTRGLAETHIVWAHSTQPWTTAQQVLNEKAFHRWSCCCWDPHISNYWIPAEVSAESLASSRTLHPTQYAFAELGLPDLQHFTLAAGCLPSSSPLHNISPHPTILSLQLPALFSLGLVPFVTCWRQAAIIRW